MYVIALTPDDHLVPQPVRVWPRRSLTALAQRGHVVTRVQWRHARHVGTTPDVALVDAVGHLAPSLEAVEALHRVQPDLPVVALVTEQDLPHIGAGSPVDDVVLDTAAVEEVELRLARAVSVRRPTSSRAPRRALDRGPVSREPGDDVSFDDLRRRHALSPGESAMLALLMHRPGVVITRELLQETDVARDALAYRSVDVLVCRLRRKLGPDGVRIHTVRGRGYRYVPAVEVAAARPA